MLGLWAMRITPSLALLPGPLRPGMVAPDRTLIKIFLSNDILINSLTIICFICLFL